MSFMMAFGLASIMLCIGMLLRAKISFLKNMLVPASVIGGIIGFIFMNATSISEMNVGTDVEMFTFIVNNLFTVSFISISLTSTPTGNGNSAKSVVQGTVGLGLVWCLLYAVTPVIATIIVLLLGKQLNVNPIYGMLVQFAFCQGPGQAAGYGAIFEQYGWEHAAMIAIAFSAIGFIAAFLVGIPAAKLGIKKGLAKNCGKLNEAISKGYFTKSEQTIVISKRWHSTLR